MLLPNPKSRERIGAMGSAAGRTQQGDQFRKLSAARRRSRDEEFDAGAETEGLVFARRVQSFEELADDVKVGIVDADFSKAATHCLRVLTAVWLSALWVLSFGANDVTVPSQDPARLIGASTSVFVDVDHLAQTPNRYGNNSLVDICQRCCCVSSLSNRLTRWIPRFDSSCSARRSVTRCWNLSSNRA